MSFAGVSDAELADAARLGSTEAFARLVDRHQAAVRAFLRRSVGDAADADDLAQETFLTAWSRLGRLRPGASVRAFLCGIAWRKRLSWRRSLARASRRDALWLETRPQTEAGVPEDRIAIERAMVELPADQRAAVALCLAGDFTHAEAAEALDLPLGTVKSHVARGRARLARALGVDDDQA
jgi:RNA polymerase sigma-70 factor (ECF subfamily)